MSFVNSLLKVFLGDKSGKDLKKLTPIVDEINNHFNKISSISNDQLRNKTIEFKKLISDETNDINSSISKLNEGCYFCIGVIAAIITNNSPIMS